MGEPSQFSVGQTAQSLTCFITEKPHTGLEECLRMLLMCFRKRKSVPGVEDDGVGDDGDSDGRVPVDRDREEDVAEKGMSVCGG